MGETFSWQPFFVVRFGVHHLHVCALSILMIEQCVVYLMVLYLRSFLSFFLVCVCCQQLFLLQRKYEDGVACWVYIVSSSIHTLFGSLFPLLCMHDHSNVSRLLVPTHIYVSVLLHSRFWSNPEHTAVSCINAPLGDTVTTIFISISVPLFCI